MYAWLICCGNVYYFSFLLYCWILLLLLYILIILIKCIPSCCCVLPSFVKRQIFARGNLSGDTMLSYLFVVKLVSNIIVFSRWFLFLMKFSSRQGVSDSFVQLCSENDHLVSRSTQICTSRPPERGFLGYVHISSHLTLCKKILLHWGQACSARTFNIYLYLDLKKLFVKW